MSPICFHRLKKYVSQISRENFPLKFEFIPIIIVWSAEITPRFSLLYLSGSVKLRKPASKWLYRLIFLDEYWFIQKTFSIPDAYISCNLHGRRLHYEICIQRLTSAQMHQYSKRHSLEYSIRQIKSITESEFLNSLSCILLTLPVSPRHLKSFLPVGE